MSYRQHHEHTLHTHTQTQRVLLEQCDQSGAVAGLVTSIRQRVRVWDKGQKRSRVCQPEKRTSVRLHAHQIFAALPEPENFHTSLSAF